MAERTASITVLLDAASAGSSASTDGGHDPQRDHLRRERLPLGRAGQAPLEEQVPDVLERQLVGQLHRVVLAVVVEALLAADVADLRLGHDDALEPGGRLDGGRVDHRLDLGHPHQGP